MQHVSIALLTIHVGKLPDGARYVEVMEHNAVVFARTLDAGATAELARLLTD